MQPNGYSFERLGCFLSGCTDKECLGSVPAGLVAEQGQFHIIVGIVGTAVFLAAC